MTDRPIAVVGPTGYTGRLVVEALVRRGADVRLVGRSLERLAAARTRFRDAPLAVQPVPSWETRALAEAFADCAAVVSCAGPFVEVGRPVAEAAIAARTPYCDCSGEQAFIRQVFDELEGPAQAAGALLVPAFGFDYVPGDLGCAIVANGLTPVARLDIVYAWASAASSAGTRRSALGVMRAEGVQYVDGAWVAERIGRRRRRVDAGFRRVVAGSFPSGEPVTVPRHCDVDTVISYLALPGLLNPGRVLARPAITALRSSRLSALAGRVVERGSAGPSDAARDAPTACHVQARARDGRTRAVLVEGRDSYGFTAVALAELALRMAAGTVSNVGVCAPAQVVEPRSFLELCGYRVRDVEPR